MILRNVSKILSVSTSSHIRKFIFWGDMKILIFFKVFTMFCGERTNMIYLNLFKDAI
jgi:hypothetical protein